MIQAIDSGATATLSGRKLALKRRQAMALHGKTGATRASAGRMAAQAVRPATAVALARARREPEMTPAPAVMSAGRSASRARREALSSAGKAALRPSAMRPSGGMRPPAAIEAATAQGDVAKATSPGVRVGRALARARRSALSQDGKAGLKRVAQAAKIAVSMPTQHWEEVISKGATGRQLAIQHRLAQSLTGSTTKTQGKNSAERVRPRTTLLASPVKVEVDPVVSGRPVTGVLLERGNRVTGNELGALRVITGTEYGGRQQLTAVDVPTPGKTATPEIRRERSVTGIVTDRSDKVTGGGPGSTRTITGTDYVSLAVDARALPEKVAVSHTSQGKTVTGTVMGSGRTTGNEQGACRAVTGTEYLSIEAFKACKTEPPQTPRKVSVMSSRDNQSISGSDVGRSAKVTGDEPGACRNITGSQYYVTDGALCNATGPRKVSVMQTLAGRTFTGSELGRTATMTGDEKGGCRSVTGTQYVGADQQAAVCDTSVPVAPVDKVAVDRTWRGQSVTGTYVGRSNKVTGDEPGGCAPISGTPYIGRGQYKSFCDTSAVKEQEALIPTSAMIPATAVTGDRPGAGGSVMTGDARGACEVVSGTPYIGVDNTNTQCATSGRFIERAAAFAEPTRPPAPQDFSITTPARAAQKKEYGGVTGVGYSHDRITGPVNKAAGLITGTPEFRHRDTADTAAEQARAAEEAAGVARRLTGEGSQAGRNVTGDAWSAMSRVTGTEGMSSQSRNPSVRGTPRVMGMNAERFREKKAERTPAPAPPSRITGSAGNTGAGALVTLSGGARG